MFDQYRDVLGNIPQLAVGVAGIVSGVCFHFSPLVPKIKAIVLKTKNSTNLESSDPIFYIITSLCYFTSSLYAEHSHDLLFLILNITGYLVFLAYLAIHDHLSDTRPVVRGVAGIKKIFAAMVVVACCAAFSYCVKSTIVRGVLAAMASVVVYAVKLGFEMRDVGPDSLLVSSRVMVLNGAIWCGYGLLGKDAFIFIPNAIGCGVGVASLVLYFRNRNTDNHEQAVPV